METEGQFTRVGSYSALWVPGIELRLSGVATNTFTH